MPRAGAGPWTHEHAFGQQLRRPGEVRTLIVIALTTVTMVVEIVAGRRYGSLALLADGLHMASHAAALGVGYAAYVYARRRARDPRFSFGTGKVNALGGFTGAVLLGVFALLMAGESLRRFLAPVPIAFDQAIVIAVLGLAVNGVSAGILAGSGSAEHHHDHNLRSATLHVLADALTSVLAILALLGARWLGAAWLDPAIGLAGAVLVGRWALGLIRASSRVLLDRQAPPAELAELRACLEDEDTRVTDLHLWTIAPGRRAAVVSVVASRPRRPQDYKDRLPADLQLAHVTIEVHAPPNRGDAGDA